MAFVRNQGSLHHFEFALPSFAHLILPGHDVPLRADEPVVCSSKTGKSHVSQTSFLKYCQLAYLSRPAEERSIYRLMAKRKPQRILEIGLGLGVRTLRMFDVARRYCDSEQISYTGIDAFEARAASTPAFPMKAAYKMLRQQGVKVKLVPGETLAAMTMTANNLANTDFIVIDAAIRDADLEKAWKYFPRMMHEGSVILRQTPDGDGASSQLLTLADVHERVDEKPSVIVKAA